MQRLGLASGSLIAAALAVLPPVDHCDVGADAAAPGPGALPQSSEQRSPPTGSTPPQQAPAPAAPAAKGSPKLDALNSARRSCRSIRGEQKKAREAESNLRRQVDQIGDDRRKLNRQLIDVAARVRDDRAADRGRRAAAAAARREGADAARVARRAPSPHRQCAGGAAAHRPQSAAGDAGDAGRRAAIGALGDPVRRGAAGDAQGRRGAGQRPLGAGGGAQGDHGRARQSRKEPRQRSPTTSRSSPALTEQRQKQQAEVEKALTAERERAAQLGRRSEDLQELIAKLEQDLDRTTRAARLAARSGEEKKATDARTGLAALKDPGRLAPAIPFARAKGTLPLPVNGVRIREFGAADGRRRAGKRPVHLGPAGRPDHSSV